MEQVKNNKKKIPKEISQEILKKMFKSILQAVGITIYFIVLNLAYSNIKQERLVNDIEIFAGVFLVVGIIFIEKAYKKDSGNLAINGIEFLVLSLHSLSIMHVITLLNYDFKTYLLTSSYVFSIYYVLKAIILYTKGRRDYLRSLSDINEIVKKDEPIKKEAQKRMDIIENTIASMETNENVEKQTEKSNKKRIVKEGIDGITKTNKNSKTKESASKVTKKVATKESASKGTKKIEKKESKSNTTKNVATKRRTTKAKTEEQEVKTTKKTTTKAKSKTEPKTTTKKTTTKPKSVKEKEEVKVPEKKKRGRPRKEENKDD